MKLLYDFGEYDDTDYVEFDIPAVMRRGFTKVVGEPIAYGDLVSIGKKRSAYKYLSSLYADTHDRNYYEKRWARVRKQAEKDSAKLAGIAWSGTVGLTYEESFDLKDYVRYMLKEDKKKEKINNLIIGLLTGLQIYEPT